MNFVANELPLTGGLIWVSIVFENRPPTPGSCRKGHCQPGESCALQRSHDAFRASRRPLWPRLRCHEPRIEVSNIRGLAKHGVVVFDIHRKTLEIVNTPAACGARSRRSVIAPRTNLGNLQERWIAKLVILDESVELAIVLRDGEFNAGTSYGNAPVSLCDRQDFGSGT